MPKLWEESIDTHRRAVRDAALDAVGALVAAHGLRGVTMSGIAARAGIGRATLYRHFQDAESVLAAWHARHVARHVDHLIHLRDGEGTALERLEAVLVAYGESVRAQPRDEIAASLHGGAHIDEAHHRLTDIVAELIAEAARDGDVRADIDAVELARYSLSALAAAAGVESGAAVGRLAMVTLSGLMSSGWPRGGGAAELTR